MDKDKTDITDHFHTLESLENVLASEDQQTLEPLDEVANI
jgi:hypothetical protein